MKKILTLLIATILVGNVYSQDKSFRFGLKIDPTVSWYKPDNVKKFAKEKAGVGFAFGAQGEILFSENFSLLIGAGLSFESASLNYSTASSADSVHYTLNNDDELQEWNYDTTLSHPTFSGNTSYWLQSRQHKINYIYLPIALKMKTKEIGMMTYYGQFGLDIKIKTKARANDNARALTIASDSTINYNTVTEKTDLNIDKGVQPIALGLNIGAGFEYNISGSTSMIFGVSYVYGMTNALKKEDSTLAEPSTDGGVEPIEQVAAMHAMRFTIGVLF